MQDAHARRGKTRLVGLLESPPARGAGEAPERGHVEFGRHALQFERLLVIESARAGEGLGDDGMRCPRDRDSGKQAACGDLDPEPCGQLRGPSQAAHEDDRTGRRFAGFETLPRDRQRHLGSEGESDEDGVLVQRALLGKRPAEQGRHAFNALRRIDAFRPRGHDHAAVAERLELRREESLVRAKTRKQDERGLHDGQACRRVAASRRSDRAAHCPCASEKPGLPS